MNEDLDLMGSWAAQIKKQILTKRFKTDLEISQFIKDFLRDKPDYVLAFPTNVNIDYMLCHYTPSSNISQSLTDCTLYTVDFGFRSLTTNHIVDNAVTVIVKETPELNLYLQEYREAIKRALKEIQKVLDTKNKLYVRDISECIQKSLEQSNVVFYIVALTCAHSIQKNKLHAYTIPMCIDPEIPSSIYNTLLRKDLIFTLEPHVLICTSAFKQKGLQAIKIYSQKSAIVQTSRGYEHVEDQIKGSQFKHISQYKSNMLSFFQEDTYKIIENNIIKVT